MKKNGLQYYFILAFLGGSIMLLSFYEEEKSLWGKIDAPDLEYQIMLYQKDRIMHQAPEILVYFQKKNSQNLRPVGNILLPEDNRNELTYEYEWSRTGVLMLMVNCDKCMIEQRKYAIDIVKNQAVLREVITDGNRSV
ncbi:MAG: Unknown protein [uncultured Aureispira sp.]|uniref:Uncharacterized protein n=1 Tax=uncultured Aureispira sp. TaxID=1331704 RepID=A0A6S6SH32_9BACT|nr:MAG: Unknown protein [uncultured Aureispira sp.]